MYKTSGVHHSALLDFVASTTQNLAEFKLASYPLLGRGVTVSLIGRDLGNVEVNDGEQGRKRLWLADVARGRWKPRSGAGWLAMMEVAQKKEEAKTFSMQQSPPLGETQMRREF